MFRLGEVNWPKVGEKPLAWMGGRVAYQGAGQQTRLEPGESGNSAGDHCRAGKADWALESRLNRRGSAGVGELSSGRWLVPLSTRLTPPHPLVRTECNAEYSGLFASSSPM